jgi:hypothetical protein
MVRLFYFFVDWCAKYNLKPADYQIVIVPKTPRAELCFKSAWAHEFAHLEWNRPDAGAIYEGMMWGVSFKIAEASHE